MFRAIRRNPGSYVTAAITVATGIGSVVAMFSIYATVVLNPMHRTPRTRWFDSHQVDRVCWKR